MRKPVHAVGGAGIISLARRCIPGPTCRRTARFPFATYLLISFAQSLGSLAPNGQLGGMNNGSARSCCVSALGEVVAPGLCQVDSRLTIVLHAHIGSPARSDAGACSGTAGLTSRPAATPTTTTAAASPLRFAAVA